MEPFGEGGRLASILVRTRGNRTRRLVQLLVPTVAVCALVGACSSDTDTNASGDSTTSTAADGSTTAPPATEPAVKTIPGMPPVVDPNNVYSETTPEDLSPAVADAKQYVYVPHNENGQVWVIDQNTYEVVGKYDVGNLVQHVVPSHDLKTLYANASGSNQLVPFDPATGKPGTPVDVDAPYNLYFTPDGKAAMVMAERLDRIDFYNATTWEKTGSTPVPCTARPGSISGGVNHADWSADGSYFIATCEFSGQLLKVDTVSGQVQGILDLGSMSMPQDCRVLPDGKTFYVADMMDGGVHVIDGPSFTKTGFIETGDGAHGIYPSRDATVAYVSNRGNTGMDRPGGGTVSVVDFATNKVVDTWTVPGGGSPDMGGVSTDGTKLWLSGRYDNVVYVFDTTNGELVKKIPVGAGPHGLAVFPQPGRYSLGHTGNYR